MIKTRTKTIVVVAVIVCLMSVGSYSVFAATAKSASTYQPIVEKIAKAFNLDPAEVNKVFEADRKEMEAKQQALYEERLDKAVKDGAITEAQKTAISEEAAAIKTKLVAIKDLTKDVQKTKMDSLRTEIQAWVKNNGLEQKQYLLDFGAFGGGPGGNGHGPGSGPGRAPGKGGMPPNFPDASKTSF